MLVERRLGREEGVGFGRFGDIALNRFARCGRQIAPGRIVEIRERRFGCVYVL